MDYEQVNAIAEANYEHNGDGRKLKASETQKDDVKEYGSISIIPTHNDGELWKNTSRDFPRAVPWKDEYGEFRVKKNLERGVWNGSVTMMPNHGENYRFEIDAAGTVFKKEANGCTRVMDHEYFQPCFWSVLTLVCFFGLYWLTQIYCPSHEGECRM